MSETHRGAILLSAVVILLAVAASPAGAALTFSWSFETDTPEVIPAGSDSTPRYYPTAAVRTDAAAHGGSYSLNTTGAYHLAEFENATNSDVWASTDEGAISLWFMYNGTFTGGRMLGMITGKCVTEPSLDTNDGLSLAFRNNTTQMRLTYGWIYESGYHTTYITYSNPTSWVEGQWYNVVFKWNADTAPHLYLQVNGGTAVTGGVAFHPTTLETWHQLLWGNDTGSAGAGTSLYVDDVQVYNDYAMTVPEPASMLLVLGGLGLIRTLSKRR